MALPFLAFLLLLLLLPICNVDATQANNVFNVRDFGAVADGESDSSQVSKLQILAEVSIFNARM